MSEFNNKDLSKDPIDTKIYLRNFRPNKGFYVLDDAYFKQVRAVLNYRVASPLSVIIHSFTDFNGTGLPTDTDADKPVFMDYVLLSNPLNGNVIAKPYISALFTKYTLTYSTKGLINKTITLTKDSTGLWSSSDETIAIDNRGVLTLPYAKVKGYSQVIATIYANDGRTNTSELLIRKLINPPSLSQDIGKTITVTVADTSEVGDKTVVYLTDKDNKNFTVTLIKKLDTSWVSDNVDLIPNIEANKNSTAIAVDKLLIGSYVKATTLIVTDKVYLSKPVQIKVLQKIGCTPTEYVFKNNAPATGVFDDTTSIIVIGMQIVLNSQKIILHVAISNSSKIISQGHYTGNAVFIGAMGNHQKGYTLVGDVTYSDLLKPHIFNNLNPETSFLTLSGIGVDNHELAKNSYLTASMTNPKFIDNPQKMVLSRLVEEDRQALLDAYKQYTPKYVDYIDAYNSGEDIIVMSCQEIIENTGDSGNVGGGGGNVGGGGGSGNGSGDGNNTTENSWTVITELGTSDSKPYTATMNGPDLHGDNYNNQVLAGMETGVFKAYKALDECAYQFTVPEGSFLTRLGIGIVMQNGINFVDFIHMQVDKKHPIDKITVKDPTKIIYKAKESPKVGEKITIWVTQQQDVIHYSVKLPYTYENKLFKETLKLPDGYENLKVYFMVMEQSYYTNTYLLKGTMPYFNSPRTVKLERLCNLTPDNIPDNPEIFEETAKNPLSYMFVEKAIPKVDSLVTAKITLNDTVLYGVYPIVGDQDREILKINHGVLFSWLMQNTHDEDRVKNASQLAFYDAAAKNYYGELKHHLIYTRNDSGITYSGITQETQNDFIKKVSGYSPLSNVQFGSQPKDVLTIDKIPDELLATIKQKLTAHTSLPTVDFLTVLGEDNPIVIRSETPAIPWLGTVNTYYLLDNPTKQIHGSIPSYTNYFRGTPYKKEITLSEAQTLKQYSPTATIMAKLGTLRIHLPNQFADKFTLSFSNERLGYFELTDTGITLFTIQSDAYKPAGTIAYAENLYLDIIIDRAKTTYKFPENSGISPTISTSNLEYRLKDFNISLPPNNPLKIEWITT